MMPANLTPLNFDLLVVSESDKKKMLPVSELAIFQESSQNFNSKGLFSTEIFGSVGSPARNVTFSYVPLNSKVIHPLVWNLLEKVNKLYLNIITGEKFAVFNKKTKDFELSDKEDKNSGTGLTFFNKHLKELKIRTTTSDKRDNKIQLIYQAIQENTFYLEDVLVLPAGLRDYTVGKDGKPSEDEVNDLYRKLMASNNTLENINVANVESNIYSSVVTKLQLCMNNIYAHFFNLKDGKKKLIQSKYIKRTTVHGTRNVLTSYSSDIVDFRNSDYPGYNDSVIGVYQYVKGTLPVTKYAVKKHIVNKIIPEVGGDALLVNSKTMKSEYVSSKEAYSNFISSEGLNNVSNIISVEGMRHRPVMVGNYYLMLVYDNKKDIKLIYDTNTIPDEINKKYLRPITYLELFYLPIMLENDICPMFVTRYPASGQGNVYPSNTYIKSTINGRRVNYLNDDWKTERTIREYPILNEETYNSFAVNNSHLPRLGGDHDGDVVSAVMLMTEDAKREIRKMLRSREYYINVYNNMTYSNDNDIVSNVIKTLIKEK